jgi:hypothetical protein
VNVRIRSEDFEKGNTREEIKKRIAEVLEKNEGYAFSLDEIRDMVFGEESGLSEAWTGGNILEELISEDRVEVREVTHEGNHHVFYHWKV